MATLIPQTQTSNVEATYEDMFKEITRKLYGEETGNGLHTLGTPVAQVATSGPTAAPEGEQRSFTNLQQIDRQSAPTIEYEQHGGNAGGNNVNVATTTAAVAAAAAAAAAVAAQNPQNVVIQQQQQQTEGSTVVVTTPSTAGTSAGAGTFKSEDHLSTAFGLAALMQNGFATAATSGGTILNKVVNNAQQQQQNAGDGQQRWTTDGTSVDQQQQQQQQPQIVQWTTGGKLQSYTAATAQQQQQQQQQVTTPKSKSKNRQDAHNNGDILYASPSTSAAQNLVQSTPTSAATITPNTSSSGGSSSSSGGGGNGVGGGGGSSRKKSSSHNQHQQQQAANGGVQIQKRYACTHCPYSTDRRDLYTRHENIHKDEKPFQCYACLKQFNRADHVKKHFLRMHRELQYDINKTRRQVSNSSGSSHSGGRGNVTISNAANVTIDNAFLESQRQPTSTSLSIVETIEAVASAADEPLPQLKQEKLDDGSLPISSNGVSGGGVTGNVKPKREKRFTCCYCPWSGADKWGLKRHLNTHTKPFVCLLCDYKAARSERLATHVLKVHNKRACNKCSYLADTQEDYQLHLSDVHLLKMDAISRNTASVAQDFHKAGGVHELKIPANHQLLFNNKLPASQWTTREAAALLHSLSNISHTNSQQQQQQHLRVRQHSTGEDDENTPSSASSTSNSNSNLSGDECTSPVKQFKKKKLVAEMATAQTASTTATTLAATTTTNENEQQQQQQQQQHKAMTTIATAFLEAAYEQNAIELLAHKRHKYNTQQQQQQQQQQHQQRNDDFDNDEDQENRVQLIKSPPAFKFNVNYNNNNNPNNNNSNNNNNYHQRVNKRQFRNAVGNSHNSSSNNSSSHRHADKENHTNSSAVIAATPIQISTDVLTATTTTLTPHATTTTGTTFLTQMEYQNLNKIGTQFQNYVKDIISKYYAAETPPTLLMPALPTATTTAQQSQSLNGGHQSVSPKRKRMLSETEEYIEYLRNKEDITLTITPKVAAGETSAKRNKPITAQTTLLKRQHDLHAPLKRTSPKRANHTVSTSATAATAGTVAGNTSTHSGRKSLNQLATLLPLLADAASKQQYLTTPLDFSKKQTSQQTLAQANNHTMTNNQKLCVTVAEAVAEPSAQTATDKRSSRKQAQPKKIRVSPEAVIAILRDKYLNRMVHRKLNCVSCAASQRHTMLIFSYHTKGSLALHRYWKHRAGSGGSCALCERKFKHRYSLAVHKLCAHGGRQRSAATTAATTSRGTCYGNR